MSVIGGIRLGKILASDVLADEAAFLDSVEISGRIVAASAPVEVLLTRNYRPARRVRRPATAPRLVEINNFLTCTALEACELEARGAVGLVNFLDDGAVQ